MRAAGTYRLSDALELVSRFSQQNNRGGVLYNFAIRGFLGTPELTGLVQLGAGWRLNGGLIWRTGSLKGLSADQSRIVGTSLWRQRRSRDFTVDDLSAFRANGLDYDKGSEPLRRVKYCAGELPSAFLNIVMKALTDS